MKKGIKILLIVVGALICAILISVIWFFSLPNMENGVVYKGSIYVPIGGTGYVHSTINLKPQKAVGRLNDAIIYTLEDDPDEIYLFPKMITLGLPRAVLMRKDALPSLNKDSIENVDKISLVIRKGSINSVSYDLNQMYTDRVLEALGGSGEILTSNYNGTHNANSETYELWIHFIRPTGVSYYAQLVRMGDTWGLLLKDGKTLIEIDAAIFKEVLQSELHIHTIDSICILTTQEANGVFCSGE